jgi:hypothetical protein
MEIYMETIQEYLEKVSKADPVPSGSLTMVPLICQDNRAVDWEVLDDALNAQKCRISEMSEDGSVSELRFENLGHQPIFLLDGEELVGAKQNRAINLSILAPPKTGMTIPVSCVEQGRWNYNRRGFATSSRAQYASNRAKKASSVSFNMRYRQSHRSDQSEVWSDISEKVCRMQVMSETDAMSDIFNATDADLDTCVSKMQPVDDQVGAVFLIGGKVSGADIFGSSQMLHKLLPKLVRSYALDAIEAPNPGSFQESVVDAFIDRVGNEGMEESPAIGLGTDFRFEDPGLAGGALVLDGRVVHLAALRVPVT